jgi:hypothetical protein
MPLSLLSSINVLTKYSNIDPYLAASNMKFAYSIRKVVSNYTGPVLNIRSSGGTTSDFYSDLSQNYLTTGAGGTGTSYATWIGNNVGFVVTWYDQSGKGNHATNSTASTQPTLVKVNGIYVIQWLFPNSNLLNITNSAIGVTQPNTIFCQFWNNNLVHGSIITTQNDFEMRFGGTTAVNINGDSNTGDWFYNATGTKLAYANNVSLSTSSGTLSGTSTWQVLSLSAQTPIWLNNSVNTYFNRVGTDGLLPASRGINGYMAELICHNTQMGANSMQSFYKNALTAIKTTAVDPFRLASNITFAYSVRVIVPTYTGAVLNIRNSAGGTSDFYSDSTQSYLTTGSGGTGTSYASWIGSNTGYVVTWYDQSGKGNHATNSTTSSQPTLVNLSGKYVVQWLKSNQTVLNITNAAVGVTQPNTIFSHFWNNNTTNPGGNILTTQYDYGMRFISGVTFGSGGNGGDWYYSGSGTKLAYGNNIDITTAGALSGTSTWQAFAVSVQTPAWTTSQTASTSYFNRVGQDGIFPTDRSINGYMSEMICHNNQMNAYSMQAFYSNILSNSLTADPYQLASNMTFAYSVRLINPVGYSGPVMNIRNSAGGTSDFYSDSTQSYLTTGVGGTGTSYASWIGANTGYVVTWYDQSGKGNHATNTTTGATQPNITTQSGKYVIQWQSANSTVLNITNAAIGVTQPNTIFSHFWNNNTSSSVGGTIITTGYDYEMRFYPNATGFDNGQQNGGDWYFSGSGTKLAYGNNVNITSTGALSGTSIWQVFSVSVQTPAWVTSQTAGNTSYFNRVGIDGYSNLRAINGYMTEMICHNTQMVASSMQAFYSNRLF